MGLCGGGGHVNLRKVIEIEAIYSIDDHCILHVSIKHYNKEGR